jgi:hypothetical protein
MLRVVLHKMETSLKDVDWPKTYTFKDFTKALRYFPKTSMMNEAEQIKKFAQEIGECTGTSVDLRVPEPYCQSRYLNDFIDRINRAKNANLKGLFDDATLIITKLKAFLANISAREPSLKTFIERETTATRAQMFSDPRTLEKGVLIMYSSDKSNIELFTDRYNRMKYCVECIIWDKEIDSDVIKEDSTENVEMKEKFLFLKDLSKKLSSSEKKHLVDLFRELLACVVGVFMTRRTNILFEGDTKIHNFSYYYKSMMITRLKELVVFKTNPFMAADGEEVTEAGSKEAYELIKKGCDYQTRLDNQFSKYVIRVETLQ